MGHIHPPPFQKAYYRNVYGSFPYADGYGRPPAIEFNPNVRLSAPRGIITTMEPYRVPLNEDGSFSITLLTCDANPIVVPHGWCWAVREDFKGGASYWMVLEYGDGSPIALSAIVPLPLEPPVVGSVAGKKGPPGDRGPQGPPGTNGAFRVWYQENRPVPTEDEVRPGDLWVERKDG